jgi:hypothetical protein
MVLPCSFEKPAGGYFFARTKATPQVEKKRMIFIIS